MPVSGRNGVRLANRGAERRAVTFENPIQLPENPRLHRRILGRNPVQVSPSQGDTVCVRAFIDDLERALERRNRTLVGAVDQASEFGAVLSGPRSRLECPGHDLIEVGDPKGLH